MCKKKKRNTHNTSTGHNKVILYLNWEKSVTHLIHTNKMAMLCETSNKIAFKCLLLIKGSLTV